MISIDLLLNIPHSAAADVRDGSGGGRRRRLGSEPHKRGLVTIDDGDPSSPRRILAVEGSTFMLTRHILLTGAHGRGVHGSFSCTQQETQTRFFFFSSSRVKVSNSSVPAHQTGITPRTSRRNSTFETLLLPH